MRPSYVLVEGPLWVLLHCDTVETNPVDYVTSSGDDLQADVIKTELKTYL